MKVLSLQVGMPQKIEWRGREIQTSMVKKTSPGPLKVSMSEIEGDKFQGAHIHGTVDSVFYAMARETYELMQQKLNLTLSNGQLGENATMSSLDESQVEIGDVFEIGSVQVQATAPRFPCEKVNFVTKDPEGQMTFASINRPGVYFKIIKPGEIPVGSELKLIKKSNSGISIAEYFRLLAEARFFKKNNHPERVSAILESPFVPDIFKQSFQKVMDSLKYA